MVESFYKDARVCITGGAGFIGAHLAEALVELGATVVIIDDLSSGRTDNLADIADHITLITDDIRNEEAIAEAIRGCSVVFHQAALASVPRSVEEPELFHDVNVNGTLRVLEAARAAGARRFVNASSSSVYGEQIAPVKVETLPLDPRSPYAATKAEAELLIQAWSHCYDIDGVSLRYFNIFGPRQRADSAYAAVVPAFIDALANDRHILIYGDGEQTRDFTPVANAVHANLLAGCSKTQFRGRAFNVALGSAVSVNDIARRIKTLMNEPDAVVEYHPPRAGDVRDSLADIHAAREHLGYDPVTDFEDGLVATVGESF